ncbi:MAG: putative nucleotidyltransferase with HDIG domain [Planctomycetota bacterium]
MSVTSLGLLQRSAVIDFANALVNAMLNRLLHARDSRFVAEAMQEVVTTLTLAHALGAEQPLQLQVDGLRLCHDGYALEGPSLQARSLLEHCADRNIAMLSFRPGLNGAEANRLFDLLLLPENLEALDRNHRDATLLAFGIRHILVTLQNPADPDNRRIGLDEQGKALNHYQNLAEALQQNHRLAQGDHELAVDQAATAVERAVNDFDEPSMLLSLAMKDDVDRFTVGHSVRVALLALQVARAMGANRDQLVHVGGAALMHDIGKSKVPQEILFKQGRLTEEEWQSMAQHPRLGAQILIEQHESVDPRTIGAAFCHHMGADGGGYPEPLMPTPPSSTSRLIRVCDVFEALTAVRPYKRALNPIEAFAIMFRNENDFDPQWLRRFAKTIGLFPIGTRVQMQDGADGLVVKQTDDICHPIVRLITGAAGVELPDGQPDIVETGVLLEGQTPIIAGISTHDRYLPVPDFDENDPAQVGPMAHDACLAQHPHDHPH